MRYHSASVLSVDRYINDDDWVMEQKLDGVRCAVTVNDDGIVSFSTKSGVRHHPAIAAELGGLPGLAVDGELMADGRLWLFDITTVVSTDLTREPQSVRRSYLEALSPMLDMVGRARVHILPSASTTAAKRELWGKVIAQNGEGVVVKRRTGTYSRTNTRTRHVLKIKITQTVDCIVIEQSPTSVVLGLVKGDQLIEVGGCSLIGREAVELGSVVEVEYLYVASKETPRLVQPRIVRNRTDKKAMDCDVEQLDGALTDRTVLLTH